MNTIPLVDLSLQHKRLRDEIAGAVLSHAGFQRLAVVLVTTPLPGLRIDKVFLVYPAVVAEGAGGDQHDQGEAGSKGPKEALSWLDPYDLNGRHYAPYNRGNGLRTLVANPGSCPAWGARIRT